MTLHLFRDPASILQPRNYFMALLLPVSPCVVHDLSSISQTFNYFLTPGLICQSMTIPLPHNYFQTRRLFYDPTTIPRPHGHNYSTSLSLFCEPLVYFATQQLFRYSTTIPQSLDNFAAPQLFLHPSTIPLPFDYSSTATLGCTATTTQPVTIS